MRQSLYKTASMEAFNLSRSQESFFQQHRKTSEKKLYAQPSELSKSSIKLKPLTFNSKPAASFNKHLLQNQTPSNKSPINLDSDLNDNQEQLSQTMKSTLPKTLAQNITPSKSSIEEQPNLEASPESKCLTKLRKRGKEVYQTVDPASPIQTTLTPEKISQNMLTHSQSEKRISAKPSPAKKSSEADLAKHRRILLSQLFSVQQKQKNEASRQQSINEEQQNSTAPAMISHGFVVPRYSFQIEQDSQVTDIKEADFTVTQAQMTDQDNGLVANKSRSISQIIVKNADQGDPMDKQPEVVPQTISPA